ncbi:hypothetical protein H4R34_004699 [Dimargaris verticillata]|uniref:Prokaryotic-type class I peptide chain release factors domain-containing protein n=1 Tax=Dimargaris verticillata TaxID=2761393 RepID=A0A9W8AYB5_9FUNG|nr:hypothetical protein H4R34_004699 [Dimargaris verticillata]
MAVNAASECKPRQTLGARLAPSPKARCTALFSTSLLRLSTGFRYVDPLANAEIASKLDKVGAKYDGLCQQLEKDDINFDKRVALEKTASKLEDIVGSFRLIQDCLKILNECEAEAQKAMAKEEDDGTADLFASEVENYREELHDLKTQLLEKLTPKDVSDTKSIILEVRPGTGGSEAGIFADELLRMYQKYAQSANLRFEITSLTREHSRFKEGIATITGDDALNKFMFESGVHRVQRVPETENQGRIHTSTVTVAVLTQPSAVDVRINQADLRIDVYRAGGAGGQHVNTTESAVRITHIPSGIVVAIQDERSQHKNKDKAMNILRARLYASEKQRAMKERREARSKLVGRGERSEKIRTYNFPKNRVTDHRINLSKYALTSVMEGVGLTEFIEHLQIHHFIDFLTDILVEE